MNLVRLVRDDQNKVRTLGLFMIGENTICQTLELPYRGNLKNVSCIVTGVFAFVFKFSEKHKRNLWHIVAPGRSEIEVHVGNTVKDTLGCVLCGTSRDGDAVSDSRVALDAFHDAMLHALDGGTSTTIEVTHADSLWPIGGNHG